MKYQVLLLEDIINQGRKGDVVNVAPGFARNFLLPKGKALLATLSTLKMRDRLQKEREEQAAHDKAEAERLAAKISGTTFETTVKVDPEGHMYGSISTADVAQILEGYGHKIEKKHVILSHPIKQIGSHQVNLRLNEGVETSIGLELKPDRVIKKPAKKPKIETPTEEETPAQESAAEKEKGEE